MLETPRTAKLVAEINRMAASSALARKVSSRYTGGLPDVLVLRRRKTPLLIEAKVAQSAIEAWARCTVLQKVTMRQSAHVLGPASVFVVAYHVDGTTTVLEVVADGSPMVWGTYPALSSVADALLQA